MSNLTNLHAILTALATEYTTEHATVRVYYGAKAQLYITGTHGEHVRAILERMIAEADDLRAKLPGRALGIAKHRGYRIWNTHDDTGLCDGKRAAVTIELTEAEDFDVLRGAVASL